MSLRWDFSTLADQLGAIVHRAESDLRLEQAVYGLDARDEMQIQTLLAECLRRAEQDEDRHLMGVALAALAQIARERGDLDRAARLEAEADRTRARRHGA